MYQALKRELLALAPTREPLSRVAECPVTLLRKLSSAVTPPPEAAVRRGKPTLPDLCHKAAPPALSSYAFARRFSRACPLRRPAEILVEESAGKVPSDDAGWQKCQIFPNTFALDGVLNDDHLLMPGRAVRRHLREFHP